MLSDGSKLQSEPPRRPAPPAPTATPVATPVATPTATPAATPAATTPAARPDDDLLDMIARVQGSRLEDQRTELPARRALTVPDDDFFSLVVRVQGGRMDDQRAAIPLQENRPDKSKAHKQ